MNPEKEDLKSLKQNQNDLCHGVLIMNHGAGTRHWCVLDDAVAKLEDRADLQRTAESRCVLRESAQVQVRPMFDFRNLALVCVICLARRSSSSGMAAIVSRTRLAT